MEKYQNKYRIPSARAAWWDYSWAGAYFITICTHQRAHFFGRIENGEMQLSPCGVLADVLWHEIPHHNQKVTLGAFVVMPNHVHGILILDGRDEKTTINGFDSTVVFSTNIYT
jgi:REP element-mobilizing transposase RayT